MGLPANFKAQLVIIEGNDKGKILPLAPGSTIIGRSKTQIVINDPRISREHVKLEFNQEKGTLHFTDLKSLNGCNLNGQSLGAGELKDGDRLQVGNTLLDCQMSRLTELTEDTRKEPVLKTQNISPFEDESEITPTQIKESKKDSKSKPKHKKKILTKSKKLWIGIAASLVIIWLLGKSGGSSNIESGQARQNPSVLDKSEVRGLFASKQYQAALEKAQSLYQKAPLDSDLEELMGDIYFEQQKIESSLQFYKRSIEHENKTKLIHFKLIKAYLAADFVSSAIQHLGVIDQMIKESPEDQELFIELADLLLNHPELNQSFDRAVIISQALQKEIAPNNPIGYRLEASVFIQKKQLKEAEGLYERALALAPDDQTLLEELTMTKLNLQDIPGAKKVTERWLQQNPNEVRALLALSYLDFYEKNYLSTIPHLMKVINLLEKAPEAPRRLEALHLLGLVYWEQGQTNEAASYLTESCKWGFKVSCQHEALLTKKPDQP